MGAKAEEKVKSLTRSVLSALGTCAAKHVTFKTYVRVYEFLILLHLLQIITLLQKHFFLLSALALFVIIQPFEALRAEALPIGNAGFLSKFYTLLSETQWLRSKYLGVKKFRGSIFKGDHTSRGQIF